jgi:3-oxoadipate enol-lactonase
MPPLVLLHGIGVDRREFLLSMPLLARRRRVIAFDLPGHGGSHFAHAGVDVRIRLLADAVVQGIEALPDAPPCVDLLGHSLGGAVALDVARRFPRLLRRLILVSSAGLTPADALTPLAASLPFVPRGFAESRRLLATSVNRPLLNNAFVAFAASAYKKRRNNRAQLQKLLAAIAAGDDALTLRDLGRIRHPTLVLWGDGDRIFPVATGRRMAEAMPNARLEILPRCGHVPPTERPVAFARRVVAFLSAD